ncbi:MAG: hypothetical protein Q8O14_08175 [bacterium]|nr:hypothetical protein [bacterium]
MFFALMGLTLVIALVLSAAVARAFRNPVGRILQRIIADEIAAAWERYLSFAMIVVGVSGGVRVHSLERYVMPEDKLGQALALTSERLVLENYQTAIGTLGAIAWMLLLFFAVALIAFVIVKGRELRREG